MKEKVYGYCGSGCKHEVLTAGDISQEVVLTTVLNVLEGSDNINVYLALPDPNNDFSDFFMVVGAMFRADEPDGRRVWRPCNDDEIGTLTVKLESKAEHQEEYNVVHVELKVKEIDPVNIRNFDVRIMLKRVGNV